MDVHDKLDELAAMVEGARAMPMSASCILNRGEVLALIDDIRELLPEEFRHAQLLLQDREAVVAEGRRESQRLIEEGQHEQERLVSQSEVLALAAEAAEQARRDAAAEAEGMRRETDAYVDGKLASFEVVLERTLAAVQRGRTKLRDRPDLAEVAEVEEDGSSPPLP